MKHLLPCNCGRSIEVQPSQAGQTISCTCGKSLQIPSMLQVKALPVARDNSTEKIVEKTKKPGNPYKSAIIMCLLGIACSVLWGIFWTLGLGILYVFYCGLTGAFFMTSLALAIRHWAKSPLAEDTTLRRKFFVLGIAMLFPAFFLSAYLYEWQPHPRFVSLKRVEFSYGSFQRPLHQDSTPIPMSEHQILWMTDENIDQMMPMELFFYFRTLESPAFSYNFQDNYEAVKDNYRIWITTNIILYILAFSGIVVSFFLPRQTAIVTGWSGSDWR